MDFFKFLNGHLDKASDSLFLKFENRTPRRPIRKMRTKCSGGGVIRCVWCEPDTTPSGSQKLKEIANRMGTGLTSSGSHIQQKQRTRWVHPILIYADREKHKFVVDNPPNPKWTTLIINITY